MAARPPITIAIRIAVLLLVAQLGHGPFSAHASVGEGASTQPEGLSTFELWSQVFPEVQTTDRDVAALIQDATDGTLDDLSLLHAGLIASQVTDRATIDDYESALDRWCDQLQQSGTMTGDARHKAAVLLEAMHRDLLGGEYDKYATELTSVFEQGHYNCVSATLLFYHLAQRFDLSVTLVERPGHAWCIVRDDTVITEVETTCAAWFRVSDNVAAREALIRSTTGLSHGGSTSRQSITPVQLIATIYYNRGVQQLEQGNYPAAMRANMIAATLDRESKTIYSNLLATVNNWSLALSQRGEYDEALDLLARGLVIEPTHASFLQNDLHIHQTWMQTLWRARHDHESTEGLERTLEVLRRAEDRHPGRADLARARQRLLSYTTQQQLRNGSHP